MLTAARHFRQQLGGWVNSLSRILSAAESGQLSDVERKRNLQNIGVIEAELAASMQTLGAIVEGGRASDRDLDHVRDWLVRTRVALTSRAPAQRPEVANQEAGGAGREGKRVAGSSR